MKDAPRRVRFLSKGKIAERHRQVLASLPGRWVVTEAGEADAVFANGDDAIAAGALGLAQKTVIGDPARLSAIALETLAREKEHTVVFAAELAPRLWADQSIRKSADWSVIESTAVVSSDHELPAALFEQLAAVRVIAGRNGHASMLFVGSGSYAVRVDTLSGTVAVLAGVRCLARERHFSIDAVGIDRRLEIGIDAAPLAAPAGIVSSTSTGATRSAPMYQSGHRLMWEWLARDEAGDYPLTLAAAADDLRLVASLLGGRSAG